MRSHRARASSLGRRALAGPVWATLLLLLVSCTAAPPRHGGEVLGEDRDALLDEARRATYGGDKPAARRRYEALLVRNPRDDEARTGLARLDAWEGHHARAAAAYRDVLSRHPDDDDVRTGLFDVLTWQGLWDEAEATLDAARRKDTPPLLACRARLEYARGDLTTGHALAERASVASGGNTELRALARRLSTGYARVTTRVLVFPAPMPALGQVDVEVSQAWRRLILGVETEHGGRPSTAAGAWSYGATWGGRATWLFGHGFSLGGEAAFGAPAASVPMLRLRAYGTAPIRPWLTSGLAYTYRRYTGGVDTHGVSPTLGLVIGDELRLDATYWLTHVRVEDPRGASESRLVHAFSFSAGRTLLPWLALRAGYAHGAEAERFPAAFQILDLVTDSVYLSADLWPYDFLRVMPLYNLTFRGPPGAERITLHTFELGALVRW
ncbi:tetratricopeptide repeat protein [Polyangium mundeleinium]|uniref:Tetratricopeptide repeat protein n=1 Tax=Polyangium mundeleinium TaxID=2995306 RepID=A0ABT5EQC6_9BACT|nr:tetratricopeptide repeat protein [Polyangium mundeleinium]MDC0743961.1 tetratricopeptide repeat protein [Polyangium mundeleinium]